MLRDCFRKMSLCLDEWHEKNLTFFDLDSDLDSDRDRGEEDPLSTHVLTVNVERLAYANYQCWHYEDEAKSGTDPDKILSAYRLTVICNHWRNLAIEEIEKFFSQLQHPSEEKLKGELCSETLGMILDRLSILYLKKLHASSPVVVQELQKQVDGLLEAGENLYTGLCAGTKRCLVFMHQKIYSKS